MNKLSLVTNVNTNSDQTMSSREIAKLTGKRHFHIIRDIEEILNQAEIGVSKFGGTYITTQGKKAKVYNLPRRECDLVVSGYSVKYRLAIIDRWHELEAKTGPLSETEIILRSAQILVNNEKELKLQKNRMNAIENKQKLQDGNTGYMTIVAYCRLNKIHQPLKQARKHGKKATRLSKEYGMIIGKIPDERWGQVNSYSADVLDEIFDI